MIEVVVGVALTALFGGLLAPLVKGEMDRRRERLDASVDLVEVLANGLWAYWKFALRVAYYGRLGERGSDDHKVALRNWDSDDAWNLGLDIQIQVSRSKRLLPRESQRALDTAQRNVVDYLDSEIDRLRTSGAPREWDAFYDALMTSKRAEIDDLLSGVADDLKLGRTRKRHPNVLVAGSTPTGDP